MPLNLGASISGRLIDTDTGHPIGDVHIEAQGVNWNGPDSYGRTHVEGRFTLRGVAPGLYHLLARAQDKGYVEKYYGQKIRREDSELIEISGAESIDGLIFEVKLGATISGRVIDGATGLAIPNMDVSAGPIGERDVSWSNTDSNGNYSLSGIPDGLIEVSVRGRGYIEVRKTTTVRDGQNVTDLDF